MPVNPASEDFYAEYRYFVVDILTNTLLAEVPFTDVSYERAIKAAGSFSGKIQVTDDTQRIFDLYESTMPGRSALYVTRNKVCVWGGIIWTRTYDIFSRTLDVSGSEFTSYFYHRLAWKTCTHVYNATISSSSGSCTVTLDAAVQVGLSVGGAVKIAFREVGNFIYDGNYAITGISSPTQFTMTVPGLPTGTYPDTVVQTHTDTYDYARHILDNMNIDYSSLDFNNDEIEPAVGTDYTVTNKALTSNVATITTSAAHGAIPGQSVLIKNVDSTFNGQYSIIAVPTSTSMTYAKTSPNVGSTAVSVISASVTNKSLTNYVATLTTSGSHGLTTGMTIVVSGVDDVSATSEIFNGTFVVASTPSGSTFTYTTSGVLDVPSTAVSGSVSATPSATIGTYGSYIEHSDIGIDYSTLGFSSQYVEPVALRGFELGVVGEALEDASDQLQGFEYRIDCEYVELTESFTRTLVLLPILLPSPPAPGELYTLAELGADQNIFEYPGNIESFSLEESAEDSATRFFVTGNIPDLGDAASQPYAAATATDILALGWPLLDLTEAENDTSDEAELYAHAYRFLQEVIPPLAKISVSVNGSMNPQVGSYQPGDWCGIIVDDPFFRGRLQSQLEPRSDILVRKIDSIKVSVPDSPTFPEKVDLSLITEWEVDKRG